MFRLEDETEKRLETLKTEAQKRRRHTEKVGGAILAGLSLLAVTMFLWILAISFKQPVTIIIILIVIAGSVIAFAWGLKMMFFGKRA